MMRQWTWTDILAAYSLATLWFIVSWKELLYPGTNFYLAAELRPNLQHIAVIADVVLLTLIFFALSVVSRGSANKIVRWITGALFVLLGILAFGPLSYELEKLFPTELQRFRSGLLPALVVVACCVPLLRTGIRFDRFRMNLRTISLFFLPFCVLVLLKSASMQAFGNSAFLQPLSLSSPRREARSEQPKKVVWIIFDELSYESLALVKRAGVETPELERMMAGSFVAHQAFAPGENTIESIPSLLIGKQFKKVAPTSPSDAELIPADGSPSLRFQDSDNIFKDVSGLGYQSGMVGWFHPYSRVLEGQIDHCYWYPLDDRRCSEYSQLTRCGTAVFARSLRTLPVGGPWIGKDLYELGSGFLRELPETQIERNTFLTSKAYDLLADRDLEFLFFHFSVPHHPYLARTDHEGKENYFTALAVADDILAEVRRKLEETGQWQKTVVIVSSDHARRWKTTEDFAFLPEEERAAATADQRIPFLVRFPGDETRLDYDQKLNTVVTRDLVRAVFESRIQSPRELSSWLGEKRLAAD